MVGISPWEGKETIFSLWVFSCEASEGGGVWLRVSASSHMIREGVGVVVGGSPVLSLSGFGVEVIGEVLVR